MARNSNTEVLIPISAIATKLGYLDEQVANRLKQSDVVSDWNGSLAVSWSTAKATLEMLAAEKATYEREQIARMAKQMDEEQHAREYPLRAYEDAQRQSRGPAIQVTTPPSSETEEWAE